MVSTRQKTSSEASFDFEMKSSEVQSSAVMPDLDLYVRELLEKSSPVLSSQSEAISSRYESGIAHLKKIKELLTTYNTTQAEGIVLMVNLSHDWQQLEGKVRRMTDTPELIKELENLKAKVFSVTGPPRLAIVSPRTISKNDETKFKYKTFFCWPPNTYTEAKYGPCPKTVPKLFKTTSKQL